MQIYRWRSVICNSCELPTLIDFCLQRLKKSKMISRCQTKMVQNDAFVNPTISAWKASHFAANVSPSNRIDAIERNVFKNIRNRPTARCTKFSKWPIGSSRSIRPSVFMRTLATSKIFITSGFRTRFIHNLKDFRSRYGCYEALALKSVIWVLPTVHITVTKHIARAFQSDDWSRCN